MPITDIVSVRLDGEELDVTEIGISGSSLYFPEGMKGNSVIIEFIAGFKEVPFDVAAAILLIAAKFFLKILRILWNNCRRLLQNLLRPHKRWGR